MKQGQRIITDKGQKGTIRYRFKDGKTWYCCITPDNWDGKDKTLIDCPEKECHPE